METPAIPTRMVLAAQLSEKKPFWLDENGREETWISLGGVVVDWLDPIEDADWFDKHNGPDTLRE